MLISVATITVDESEARAVRASRSTCTYPYPVARQALWGQICESGAAVSEMPPGTIAWRWDFPARNRIAAALSATTVVVDAAERSGTMITVQLARKMGHELGALPGPVTSEVSAGPNGLLAQGRQGDPKRLRPARRDRRLQGRGRDPVP